MVKRVYSWGVATVTVLGAGWLQFSLGLDHVPHIPFSRPDSAYLSSLLRGGAAFLFVVPAYCLLGRAALLLSGTERRIARSFFVTLLCGVLLYDAYLFLAGHFFPVGTVLVLLPFLPGLILSSPRKIPSLLGATMRDARSTWKCLGGFERIFFGMTGLAIALAFLGTASPPTGMDALVYHFGLPSQYLVRHTLRLRDITPYCYYPQVAELASIPFLLLDPVGIGANLFCGLVFGGLVIAIGRLVLEISRSRTAAVCAAGTVATSWLLLEITFQSKNDLLLLLFLVQGIRLIATAETKSPRLGALFLGAACAVKLIAAAAVLPLLVSILITEKKRRRWEIPFLAAGPLFPWLVRNLLLLHAPLPGNLASVLSASLGQPTFWGRIRHLGLSFVREYPSGIQGPIGPGLLALVLLGFPAVRRNKPAFLLETSGIFSLILWMLFAQAQARYALPGVTLLAAAGAVRLARQGILMYAILLFTCCVSLGAGVQNSLRNHPAIWLLSGRTDLPGAIQPWLNSYRLQVRANRVLPADANVISIGESRLFYLKRRATFDSPDEPQRVLREAALLGDPARLRWRLLEQGYTHVLYNPAALAVSISAGRGTARSGLNGIPILRRMLGDLEVVATDPHWKSVSSRTGIGTLKLFSLRNKAGKRKHAREKFKKSPPSQRTQIFRSDIPSMPEPNTITVIPRRAQPDEESPGSAIHR
ncbi:MAG: hypothetical protein D6679_06815 [Candidatus Hydrogenedentota bacterium]|nr:MAG: hypothetical protein D6679_06815 [Candidatus Hydrogenedentota bacterium]